MQRRFIASDAVSFGMQKKMSLVRKGCGREEVGDDLMQQNIANQEQQIPSLVRMPAVLLN